LRERGRKYEKNKSINRALLEREGERDAERYKREICERESTHAREKKREMREK
jgi:hypothetical protein